MKTLVFAGAMLALPLHAEDGVSVINGRRSVVRKECRAKTLASIAETAVNSGE